MITFAAMNIPTAKQEHKKVTYGDDAYQKLLDKLEEKSNQKEYNLILLAGKNKKSKQKACDDIRQRTGRESRIVDANNLITKSEPETYKNIEAAFSHFDTEGELLHVTHGGRLNGSYTGYTNSKIKYATPQERFFFKKVQQTGGIVLVDLHDSTDGDTTLHRAAQSVILFPVPQSFFKNLMWNLKHITLNGVKIRTERPPRGGQPSGNFK